MANFVFNIAKGKVAEYAERVNANDPVNSAFVLLVLATTDLEADSVLIDADTVAALLAGTTSEVTNTNYARKEITALTVAVDDTNDRTTVDMADQTWSAIAAGDGWSKLVIAYDSDTTGGTDADLIPLVALDLTIVPDGSDLEIIFNADGFFRAS